MNGDRTRTRWMIFAFAIAFGGIAWLAWEFIGSEQEPDVAWESPVEPDPALEWSPELEGFAPPAETDETETVDVERAEIARVYSKRGQDDGSTGVVSYSGRVLDLSRHPVANATVELWLESRSVETTLSDVEGRFRLESSTRTGNGLYGAAVYARDSNGNAAARAGYSFSRSRQEDLVRTSATARWESWSDLGDLILQPSYNLTVEVIADGIPRANADIHLEVGRNRALVRRGRSGPDGRCVLDGVPAGGVFAVASDGDCSGRARCNLETEPQGTLQIQLVPQHVVSLQVLDATSSTIAGAEVRAIEQLRPPEERNAEDAFDPYWPFRTLDVQVEPTDADGRTQVPGLHSDQILHLQVLAAGHRSKFARIDLRADDPTVVRLDALSDRVVRFPLVAGTAAVPTDGTPVEIHIDPIAFVDLGLEFVSGEVTGGELVIRGVASRRLRGFAVTDDGRAGFFVVDPKQELGPAVSFRPPRQVRVQVLASGQPVTDARVALKEGGVNRAPFTPADEHGTVLFPGVLGKQVDVQVSLPPHRNLLPAGRVNLDQSDGDVSFEIPHAVQALVRVRIDGAPGLPAQYQIKGPAHVTAEDPDLGELELSIRPPKRPTPTISFEAWGFEKVLLPIQDDLVDGPQVFEVNLERTGIAILHFLTAPHLPLEFELQRWNEAKATWGYATYFRQGKTAVPRTSEGGLVFEPLEAGTYRWRERKAGLLLDTVQLDPSQGPVERSFDPRLLDWVTGEVTSDTPLQWQQVRILVTAPALDLPVPPGRLPGHTVGNGGKFRFLLPTSFSAQLDLAHASYSVDPGLGRAYAAGGDEGVELHFSVGSTATLDLKQVAKWIDVWGPGLRLELFEGDVRGTPRFTARPRVQGNLVRFGGFKPGRYRMWLDPGVFLAPLELDVELSEGPNDLGAVTFLNASRVNIKLLGAAGQVPDVNVAARHLGSPAYSRHAASRKRAEFPLLGLGAGRFKLTARSGGRVIAESELQLDGQQDFEWQIDVSG